MDTQLIEEIIRDIWFGIRTLSRSPLFALTALAALALGIGANTAVFTVVDSVLLRPLPLPEPERLVALMNTSPKGAFVGASTARFNAWRNATDVLQDVAAFRAAQLNLTGVDTPEQIQAIQASPEFFTVYSAMPAQGRAFNLSEDRPGGPHVAVISNGLRNRHFAAGDALGKTIEVGGERYAIVGILSDNIRKSFETVPDVIVPLQLDRQGSDQRMFFQCVARLQPGVSVAQGNARLAAIAQQFRRDYPGVLDPTDGFSVELLADLLVRDVRSSLLVLAGAVALVLLIACANVANLLLVRSSGRQRELAIRAAVGAGRGRVIRQLLTESLVLAMAGGVAGLGLGYAGIRALLAASPQNIPGAGEGGRLAVLDWRIVLFSLGLSLATGVIFGLLPALGSSGMDLTTALKSGGRSGTGLHQNRLSRALVVTEVALAVVLLIGSALLVRTFLALRSVEPGYQTHNILAMSLSLTEPRFRTTAGMDRLFQDVLGRIRQTGGVQTASISSGVPLEGTSNMKFLVPGRTADDPSGHGSTGWVSVAGDYFGVFDIPAVEGRGFRESDNAAGLPVAVVSQAMAAKFWRGRNPVGEQIVLTLGSIVQDRPRQIVGVVGDVRDAGLNKNPGPVVYFPAAQAPDGLTTWMNGLRPSIIEVRTRVEPHALSATLQNELRQASGLPAAKLRTMDEVVARSTAYQDFNMILLMVFSCSALALASIGIYGLMAYSVAQRTKELGIRLAIGAGTADVRNMIVREGMLLAFVGVTLGLVGAVGLTGLLRTLLFGVTNLDPVSFAVVPVLLLGVALAAILVPALRATQIDPITALRSE